MKLAISNLAFSPNDREQVFQLMYEYGFSGLEVAPTMIFPDKPYEHLLEARKYSADLKRKHIYIPSLQSIWYQREEKLFGTQEERERLFGYTCAAMDFAATVGAKNLVFGSPRNRCLPEENLSVAESVGTPFFRALGREAEKRQVRIGIEANPTIYHTNYLTRTEEVLDLVESVSMKGLGVNLDLGTMLENQESAKLLRGKVPLISHVHISEPYLAPVQPHELHQEIARILREEKYQGWVSIEMKKSSLTEIAQVLAYVREVFYD